MNDLAVVFDNQALYHKNWCDQDPALLLKDKDHKFCTRHDGRMILDQRETNALSSQKQS